MSAPIRAEPSNDGRYDRHRQRIRNATRTLLPDDTNQGHRSHVSPHLFRLGDSLQAKPRSDTRANYARLTTTAAAMPCGMRFTETQASLSVNLGGPANTWAGHAGSGDS